MWSRSRQCESCGLAEASDTDDAGMAYFRNVLITAESFGVALELVSKADLLLALQSVRATSIVATDEVGSAMLRGEWRGTRPEAAWVVAALEERGFRARVEQRSGTLN